METKFIIQIAIVAEIKEQPARRFDSLCSKYKVPEYDKALFVATMLYCRMEAYEFLCGKYKMAEADRNDLAGSLVMALTARNSAGTGRLFLK